MGHLHWPIIHLHRCSLLPSYWQRRRVTGIASQNLSTLPSWPLITILWPDLPPRCDSNDTQPPWPLTVINKGDHKLPLPALPQVTIYRDPTKHRGVLHALPANIPSLVKENGNAMKAPSVSHKDFGSVCLVTPQYQRRTDGFVPFASSYG
jgi:hypothetical protein